MSLFSARMSLKEATKFCQRFGTGLRAGLDVLKLLDSETRQGPASQRRAMERLVDRVHAGDESGKVDRALILLARHFEQRLQTRKSFVASITPPMLQLFAGVGVISLLIYVMGIFTPAGGGQMTDVLGLGLRGGSGVLKLWTGFGLILATIVAAVFCYGRNVGGVQNVVPIFYMIPKLGAAIQTITLSKFCAAMALAFESGLDPMRSIELGLASTASDYYRSGGEPAREAIRRGADLAGGLRATHLFPPELLTQVDLAETSGTAAEAMNRLAEDYAARAQTAVAVLAGIATFLVRGAVMGFFVFMIFRIARTYLGALNGAMEPI